MNELEGFITSTVKRMYLVENRLHCFLLFILLSFNLQRHPLLFDLDIYTKYHRDLVMHLDYEETMVYLIMLNFSTEIQNN